MSTKPDGTRVAYRPADIAAMTGLSERYIGQAIDRGEIPRVGSRRPKAPVMVPAWAVNALVATGDWWHPNFRPAEFPTNEKTPAAVTARA